MTSPTYLRHTVLTLFLMVAATLMAQKSNIDKSQADVFVYESLTNMASVNYDADRVDFKPSELVKTNERSIYILPGDHYQLETLRSDCFLRKRINGYVVISDRHYPVETFTNQLLNKVKSGHQLHVKHHQYGQKIPMLKTSLQSLFSLFLPTMKPYVSVTSINEKDIEAILIFHHPKLDFIHLLIIKTNTDGLLKDGNVIHGDFYTNIPQDNVKSLIEK